MTPLHMSILLHYHTRPGDWECPTDTHNQFVADHLRHGLLEPYKRGDGQKYCISEKGEVWLRAALDTPMPGADMENPGP